MPGLGLRVVAAGHIGKNRARRGNPQSIEKNCMERALPREVVLSLRFIKNAVFSANSSGSHHSVPVLRAPRTHYGQPKKEKQA